MKLKFPPINELVIGVYFNVPLLGLRAEHIGLFWHSVRGEFPNVSQAAPIVPQGQHGTPALMELVPGELFPLPRFWFVSADDSVLVQLQRNALLFNWRKRDTEYPHYASVKKEFDRVYGIFAEFARATVKQDFAIEATELTYINVVLTGKHWTGPDDVAKVIPSFRPIELGIEGAKLADATHSTMWDVEKDLRLGVKVQTAILSADKRPALIFELSAKGRHGAATKVEADKWFDRAHQLTRKAFLGMTDPEILARVWQPESGKS